MHSIKCSNCKEMTGCICLAQYRHNNQSENLCEVCYNDGVRCWYDPLTQSLLIGMVQPENCVAAKLYWDEGLYVTGGNEQPIYPQITQN